MERVTGTVTKIVGTRSHVNAGEAGHFECDLRGKLFRKKGLRLAVGDRVEVLPGEEVPQPDPEAPADAPSSPRQGVIEALLPRQGALRRARDFKRDQVVCANVDRVYVVTAVMDPPYKRAFLDRVLLAVERDELEGALIFNKLDLSDQEYRELIEEDAQVYARLGYGIHLVSATTGEGLEELQAALAGRISVFVGPSGVGKSTLLNRLLPGVELRTGEVSDVDGRGRHTTTSAELLELPGGGFVVDTPGVRAFGIWDVEPEDVALGFREVAELAPECRFRDCAHEKEPRCAVRAAVESGEVDHERYESYLKLRDEVASKGDERQAARRR